MENYKIEDCVKHYMDFPKEGIDFIDLNPLYTNPDLMKFIVKNLKPSDGVEALLAFEARGFILGTALSMQYNIPLVLVRKPGKMPGEKLSASGSIEYGMNTFEVQKDLLCRYKTVAMVDDLIATGGTIKICQDLCKQAGSNLKEVISIWKIKGLAPKFEDLPLKFLAKQ